MKAIARTVRSGSLIALLFVVAAATGFGQSIVTIGQSRAATWSTTRSDGSRFNYTVTVPSVYTSGGTRYFRGSSVTVTVSKWEQRNDLRSYYVDAARNGSKFVNEGNSKTANNNGSFSRSFSSNDKFTAQGYLNRLFGQDAIGSGVSFTTVRDAGAPILNSLGFNLLQTSSPFTGTVSASDSGAGIHGSNSGTFTVTGEGRHDVTVTMIDRVGNSRTSTFTVTIDLTAPVLTIDPVSQPGNAASVTVEGTVSDAVFAPADITLEYTLDGGAWTEFTAIGGSFSFEVEENGLFEIRATDPAGRSSQQSVVITGVDSTGPAISFDEGWDTSGIRTATAIDTGAGLDSSSWEHRIGPEGNPWLPGATVTAPFEGESEVWFRVRDINGNESISSFILRYDVTPPEIATTFTEPLGYLSGEWTDASTVAVDIVTTDVASSVATVLSSVNGAPLATLPSNQLSFSDEGEQTLEIVATDVAGNQASLTRVIRVDRTAPTLESVQLLNSDGTLIPVGAYSGAASVRARLVFSDASNGEAPLSTYRYRVFELGAEPFPSATLPVPPDKTIPITWLDSGDFVLSVTISDEAGNTSEPTTLPFRFDLETPNTPTVRSTTHPPARYGESTGFQLLGAASRTTAVFEFSATSSGPSGVESFVYALETSPVSELVGARPSSSYTLPADALVVPAGQSVVFSDLTDNMQDNAYSLYVAAISPSGRTSPVAAYDFAVDTTPPDELTLEVSPFVSTAVWYGARVASLAWNEPVDFSGIARYAVRSELIDESDVDLVPAVPGIGEDFGPEWTPALVREMALDLRAATGQDAGIVRITVAAEDTAGNRQFAWQTVRFDTVGPTFPVAPVAAPDVEDRSIQIDWTPATDDEGSGVVTSYGVTLQVLESGTLVEARPAKNLPYDDGMGPVSGTRFTELEPDQVYVVTITAIDAAGNSTSVSIPALLTTDEVPPESILLPFSSRVGGFTISGTALPDGSNASGAIALPSELLAEDVASGDAILEIALDSVTLSGSDVDAAASIVTADFHARPGGFAVTANGVQATTGVSLTTVALDVPIVGANPTHSLDLGDLSIGDVPDLRPIHSSPVDISALELRLSSSSAADVWELSDINLGSFSAGSFLIDQGVLAAPGIATAPVEITVPGPSGPEHAVPLQVIQLGPDWAIRNATLRTTSDITLSLSGTQFLIRDGYVEDDRIVVTDATAFLGPGYSPQEISVGGFSVTAGGIVERGVAFSADPVLYVASDGTTFALGNLDISSAGLTAGTVAITTPQGRELQFSDLEFGEGGVRFADNLSDGSYGASVAGYDFAATQIRLEAQGYVLVNPTVTNVPAQFGAGTWEFDEIGFRYEDDTLYLEGATDQSFPVSLPIDSSASITGITARADGLFANSVAFSLPAHAGSHTATVTDVQLVIDGTFGDGALVPGSPLSVGGWHGIVQGGSLVTGTEVIVQSATFDLLAIGGPTDTAFIGLVFDPSQIVSPATSEATVDGNFGSWTARFAGLRIGDVGLVAELLVDMPSELGGYWITLADTGIAPDGSVTLPANVDGQFLRINGFPVNADEIVLLPDELQIGLASVLLYDSMGGGTLPISNVVVSSLGEITQFGAPTGPATFTSTAGFDVAATDYRFDSVSISMGGSLRLPGIGSTSVSYPNGAIRLYPDGTVETASRSDSVAWRVDDWDVLVEQYRFARSYFVAERSIIGVLEGNIAVELPEMQVWADGTFREPGLLAEYLDLDFAGLRLGANRATFDEQGLRFSAFVELPDMFGGSVVYFDEVDVGGDGSIQTDTIIPYLVVPFGRFGSAQMWNVYFSEGVFQVGEALFEIQLEDQLLVAEVENFSISSAGVLFDNARVDPFPLFGLQVYVDSLSSTATGLSFQGAVRLPDTMPNQLGNRLLKIEQFEIGWETGLEVFELTLDGQIEFPITDDREWVATVTDIGVELALDPFDLAIKMDEARVRIPPSLGVGNNASAAVQGIELNVTTADLRFDAIQISNLETTLFNTDFVLDQLTIEQSGRAVLSGSATLPSDLPAPFTSATVSVPMLEILPGGVLGDIDASATGLSGRLFDTLFLQNGVISISRVEGIARLGVEGSVLFEQGFPSGILGKQATISEFVINLSDFQVEKFAASGGEFDFTLGQQLEIRESVLGISYDSTEQLFAVSATGKIILPTGMPEFLAGEPVTITAFTLDSTGTVQSFAAGLTVNGQHQLVGGLDIADISLRAEYIDDLFVFGASGSLVFTDAFPEGIRGATATVDRFEFDSDGNLRSLATTIALDDFRLLNALDVTGASLSFSKLPGTPAVISVAAATELPDSFPEGLAGRPVDINPFTFDLDGNILAFDAGVSEIDVTLFGGLSVSNGSIRSSYVGGDEFVFTVDGAVGMPSSLGPIVGELTFDIDSFQVSTTRGLLSFSVSSTEEVRKELFPGADVVVDSVSVSDRGVSLVAGVEFDQSYPSGLGGTRIGIDTFTILWDGTVETFSGGLDYLVLEPAGFRIAITDLVISQTGVTLGSATLELPGNLAGTEVSLVNAGIGTDGQFFGDIELSDISIVVAGFTLRLENPDLDFDNQRVAFDRAMLQTPDFVGNFELEVAGVEISPSGLSISGGEFRLPDFTIPGGMGFSNVRVAFVLDGDGGYTVGGSATAVIPGVGSISAEISFTNRSELYPIGLQYAFFEYRAAGLGLPLGTTGMYINGIRGGIAFGPPNEVPQVVQRLFGNGTRLQLGLSMQDQTFGNVVKGDVDVWVDVTDWDWAIQGNVSVLRGLLRADMTAALSLSKGFYGNFGIQMTYVRGRVETYIFHYGGTTRINAEGKVQLGIPRGFFFERRWRVFRRTYSVRVPSRDWWFGGVGVRLGTFANRQQGALGYVRASVLGRSRTFSVFAPRGNGRVRIVNASSYRLYRPPWLSIQGSLGQVANVTPDPSAVLYGSLLVSDPEPSIQLEASGPGADQIVVAGAGGEFRDELSFDVPAAAPEVAAPTSRFATPMQVSGYSGMTLGVVATPVTEPVDAEALTDWLMIVVGYGEGNPDITLFDPNGVEYGLDHPDVSTEYGPGSIMIALDDPIAGTWNVRVLGLAGPDAYEMEVYGFQDDAVVTIENVSQPELPVSGVFNVSGATDPDLSGNEVTIFFHDQEEGPGRAVSQVTVSVDGSFTAPIETTALENGEYWVSAQVETLEGYAAFALAEGSLLVSNVGVTIPVVSSVIATEIEPGIVRVALTDTVAERPYGYEVSYEQDGDEKWYFIGPTRSIDLPGFEPGESVEIGVAARGSNGSVSALVYASPITIGASGSQTPVLEDATMDLISGEVVFTGQSTDLFARLSQAAQVADAFVEVTSPVEGLGGFVTDPIAGVSDGSSEFMISISASETLGPGIYPMELVLTNAANASDQLVTPFTVDVRHPAPVVTEVAPNNWNALDETEVAIQGRNFMPGTIVTLAGTELEVLSRDEFTITVRVPANTAGGEPELLVTGPSGGQSAATVFVLEPSYLISISGDRIITETGGTGSLAFALFGENRFSGSLGVTASTAEAELQVSIPQALSVNETVELTVLAGPGAIAGTYGVDVTFSDGTVLTVPVDVTATAPDPTITSLFPPVVTAGDELTVYGYGFGPNGTLRLGSAILPPISASNEAITVQVPAGATSGPVTVERDGLISNAPQLIVLARDYTLSTPETVVRLQHGESREIPIVVNGSVGLVSLDADATHESVVTALASVSVETGSETTLTVSVLEAIPTGTYQVTVDANGAGVQKSLTIELVVGEVFQFATQEIAPAMVGVPYEYPLRTENGDDPVQFEIESGSLPAGLAVSASGVISGTPVAPGLDQVTLFAVDNEGREARATFEIRVEESAWSSIAGNQGATNHNPVDLPAGPFELWRSVAFSESHSLLTGLNRLFAVSENGVAFLDVETGGLLFVISTPVETVFYQSETLFVFGDGVLTAYDPASATVRWTREGGSVVETDGALVYVADDESVSAIRVSDGTLATDKPAPQALDGDHPVWYGDTRYSADADSLVIWNAATTLTTSVTLGAPIDRLSADALGVLALLQNGELVSLAHDGSETLRRFVGYGYSSVALSPQRVVLAGTAGTAIVERATFVVVATDASSAASVATGNEYVVTSEPARMAVRNGITASAIWSVPQSARALAIARNTLFALQDDGRIIAYRGPRNLAAPVTTLVTEPALADGANGWFVTAPTVRVEGTDAETRIATSEIRRDGEPWADGTVPLALSDGDQSVSHRATDTHGLLSTARTDRFFVDTVPPATLSTVESTAGPNGTILGSVTVTATATDETSGVERLEYSRAGGPWQQFFSTFTESTEGPLDLAWRAVDNAGNIEPAATLGGWIDLYAPQTYGTVSYQSDVAWITLTATDGELGSGVARIEFRIDAGAVQIYDEPIEITRSDYRSVVFRAVDLAERASQWSTIWVERAEGTDPMEGVVAAINAGGDAFTSTTGIQFAADQFFTGGTTQNKSGMEIAGTYDDELYQTYRQGTVDYQIPAAPGNYEVELHFAETFHSSPGGRVMDVRVEGQATAPTLDLTATAGFRTAYVLTEEARVTDGAISITAWGTQAQPVLSAIVVRETDAMDGVLYTINAGGDPVIDAEGLRYDADHLFVNGASETTGLSIGAGSDTALYETARTGAFAYALAVENGTYEVRLRLAEPDAAQPDDRVFTIRAEHILARRQLDLTAEYGAQTPVELAFHVEVDDGILDLAFEPETGDALVSAILVREADPMATVEYAINAGGGAYVATDGVRYQADAYSSGGSTNTRIRDVGGTLEDVLHHSFREGTFSYELPVENGAYVVELQFSDSFHDGPGDREFDVRIEYHQAFGDLDVFAESGGISVALTKEYQVLVTDGSLSLRFIRDNKNAILSSILVRKGDPMFDVVHAVNLGGGSHRATDGVRYEADPAGTGTVTAAAISGTYDDALYQSQRTGSTSYAVALDPGPYQVTVGAAGTTLEPQTVTATVEGQTVLDAVTLERDVATTGSAELLLHDGTLDFSVSGTPEGAAGFLLVRRGDPMVGVVHAINAGGNAYEATDGIRYDADRDFTGGSDKTRANEITGTDDDVVYQTYREGNATYTLPVTPGAYEVTLHFAETFQNNPGARIVTVRVGDVEMRDIDVLAAVGKNAAYQITIPVSVAGTELTVETVGQKKKAILGAIVVREAE